jgi:hypothetical protein
MRPQFCVKSFGFSLSRDCSVLFKQWYLICETLTVIRGGSYSIAGHVLNTQTCYIYEVYLPPAMCLLKFAHGLLGTIFCHLKSHNYIREGKFQKLKIYHHIPTRKRKTFYKSMLCSMLISVWWKYCYFPQGLKLGPQLSIQMPYFHAKHTLKAKTHVNNNSWTSSAHSKLSRLLQYSNIYHSFSLKFKCFSTHELYMHVTWLTKLVKIAIFVNKGHKMITNWFIFIRSL